MIRKAIQLANNTLVVSLPAKWVQQNNIGKGADLEVDVKDTSLMVRKGAAVGQEMRKIRLDISGMSASLVWSYLNATYRAGFNEIEVFFSESKVKNLKTGQTKNTMEIIATSCDKLIGMEIIKQSKNSCMLREVTQLKGDEYSAVFNRIFLSLITVSQDIIDAAGKNDYETLEYIYLYSENNVNKLADYCFRILNISGSKDFSESDSNYLMTFILEEVGDMYAEVAKALVKNKGKRLPQDILALLKTTNELLVLSHRFFLNPKKEYYVGFHESRFLAKKSINSSRSLASYSPEIVFSLRNIIDKLMELNNAKVTIAPLL